MLLKACLNGPRDVSEHRALPLSAEQLAADALACVRAGAGAIHLHPRGADGGESLEAGVVDPVVRLVRAACGVPVGVATGAWVEPEPERRAALVAAWTEPDFASVNLSEPGAVPVMRALLAAGVGVEAGVWSTSDAERLGASGLGDRLTRVLVEVMEGADAVAAASALEIDGALDRAGFTAPRLHHGEGPACWPVLRQALVLGRDIRIGLEDTLVLPDGSARARQRRSGRPAAAAGLRRCPHGRLHSPRLDRAARPPRARRRLRGVPRGRHAVGAPADVPDLRPHRLLRQLARAPRDGAPRGRAGTRSSARPSRARTGAGATWTS